MKYLSIFILLSSFSVYSQNNKTNSNKSLAESELKIALTDKGQHNVIDNKTNILEDEKTAINVAEAILFNLYGEENIRNQKPYQVNFVNNHWILSGSLPLDSIGGTFLIILDAKDSKVLKITHGK